MKTRVNVYLSVEALELADRLAKEEGVSRSVIIDRSITQTQTLRADTNTNTPINLPDGFGQSLKQIQEIINTSTKLVESQQEAVIEYKKITRQGNGSEVKGQDVEVNGFTKKDIEEIKEYLEELSEAAKQRRLERERKQKGDDD